MSSQNDRDHTYNVLNYAGGTYKLPEWISASDDLLITVWHTLPAGMLFQTSRAVLLKHGILSAIAVNVQTAVSTHDCYIPTQGCNISALLTMMSVGLKTSFNIT